VILRPCRWGATPFAKLQAAPTDAKPVTSWPDPDAALYDVAGKIEQVVNELQQQRRHAAEQVQQQAEEARKRQAAEEDQRQALRRQRERNEAQKQADAEARQVAEQQRRLAQQQRERLEQPRLEATAAARFADFAVFRDVDAPWCPEMVALPAGEFLMGSPEDEKERLEREGPQHRVTIERRFALGRYAVTIEEYDHFCAVTKREKPGDQGWGRGRRPVINVNWRDAVAYCEWLVKETGKPYRLPSESEWEYACRAGTTTRYAFGDAITPKNANYGMGKTTEVGAYPPNPWGLYDMHGNVWEWVEDVWHDSYKGAPTDGSAWTDGEGIQPSRDRVYRGGSWLNYPRSLRSAIRLRFAPVIRYLILGFRVARTLD
jgi:formylglycine-generating enzyme required for sulfatase activity